MLERFIRISDWLWNNISNIDAIISIIIVITTIISAIIRLSNNHNCLKKIELDKQTKQSMKYYVPTRGLGIDPCDQEDIDNDSGFELIPFFMNEFKYSESKYFIILADSGMGKTTFLLKLFFKYKRKLFKKYKIVLLPLSSPETLDDIKKINKKQRTILLLDSFDEDSYAMEDYEKRLEVICKETESFYKIIITCRTQFFPDSENEPRITGNLNKGIGKKNVEFEKFYILPFSDAQIYRYLKNKYKRFSEKGKIDKSLNLISKCPQLVVRPMLLSHIDDLIEDSEKEYRNVYEIYDQLISKWIDEEALKNNILLYEFSEKVAEYMYYNKTNYIEALEIDNLCKEYSIKLRSIEAKSRSLLNRNAKGAYKFAHRSILEFFLATLAIRKYEFRETITLDDFKGYSMVKLFLQENDAIKMQELLKNKSFEIRDIDFNYAQLNDINFSHLNIISCSFWACNFAKANFTETKFTCVYLGYSEFVEAVLIGADFAGENLGSINFTKANLEGADLRISNLEKSWFIDANLRNAKLKGANLESSVWKLTDIEKAYLQLKEAKFSNIVVIVEDKWLEVSRDKLFPDE